MCKRSAKRRLESDDNFGRCRFNRQADMSAYLARSSLSNIRVRLQAPWVCHAMSNLSRLLRPAPEVHILRPKDFPLQLSLRSSKRTDGKLASDQAKAMTNNATKLCPVDYPDFKSVFVLEQRQELVVDCMVS